MARRPQGSSGAHRSTFGVHPKLAPYYNIRNSAHPDVEFEVYDASARFPSVFKTFGEAAAFALAEAASEGVVINVDVLVYSEAGAEHWGGPGARGAYKHYRPPGWPRDVPNVFARIEVSGNITQGRLP